MPRARRPFCELEPRGSHARLAGEFRAAPCTLLTRAGPPVGAATSPFGPFRYQGPLLQPVIGWTTHHSIVQWDDHW